VDKLLAQKFNFQTPEDLGKTVAKMLLREIMLGGYVDRTSVWLNILLMVCCKDDVSKIRVGPLNEFT